MSLPSKDCTFYEINNLFLLKIPYGIQFSSSATRREIAWKWGRKQTLTPPTVHWGTGKGPSPLPLLAPQPSSPLLLSQDRINISSPEAALVCFTSSSAVSSAEYGHSSPQIPACNGSVAPSKPQFPHHKKCHHVAADLRRLLWHSEPLSLGGLPS